MDVLVVEDETLTRMMIVEMVEELGHRVVAEAATIRDAEQLARNELFDLAILDINVGGESVHPIALIIAGRSVPFLFASGYGSTGLPAPFDKRPILRKPFAIQELGRAIETIRSA